MSKDKLLSPKVEAYYYLDMANPSLEAIVTSAKASEPHPELVHRHPRGKKSTREKIDKLVAEGAKNYPAYLKLIYTGDSELSSEDEFFCAENKARLNARKKLTSRMTHEPEASVLMKPSVVLSPESAKLMDPGREKLPTPVDQSTESKPLASLTSNRATGKTIIHPCPALARLCFSINYSTLPVVPVISRDHSLPGQIFPNVAG